MFTLTKPIKKGIGGTIVGAVATAVGTVLAMVLANNLGLDDTTRTEIQAAIITLVVGISAGGLNAWKHRKR